MKALKCDVCGGYFDGLEKLSQITKETKPNRILISYSTMNGNFIHEVESDICPDCSAAIEKALNDRRRIEVCSD